MKILKLLLSFMFICNLAFADSALDGVPGLIYLKNFAVNQSQTADYANGSNVITATAARSATAPDTYIDSAGKINISTTPNTLLFDQGYYNTTGFHIQPGAHVYGSGTNYVLNSYFSLDSNADGTADSWTSNAVYNPSLETCSINNITGGKSQRTSRTISSEVSRYSYAIDTLTNNDTFDASGGNITISLSFWAKGDLSNLTTGLTGNMFAYIEERDNAETFQRTALFVSISQIKTAGLDSEWKKFNYTTTVIDTDTRKLRLAFLYFTKPDGSRPTTGESFWIEIYGVNLEKSPYVTPFIPTTNTIASRPGQVIKFITSGNRNANEETIIVKFSPCSDFLVGNEKQLSGSETKYRHITKTSPSNVTFKPNSSDSTTVSATFSIGGSDLLKNTSNVIASRCQHSSPYSSIFLNGTLKNSYTNDNWINPDWGNYSSIGSGVDNNKHSDSIIQAIAIFNRALTDDEVTKLSSSNFTLNNNSLLIAGN